MAEALDALIFDFVEWVAKEPRSYAEALDAWRTSCPRLTVWEEATNKQLVRREAKRDRDVYIVVTPWVRNF